MRVRKARASRRNQHIASQGDFKATRDRNPIDRTNDGFCTGFNRAHGIGFRLFGCRIAHREWVRGQFFQIKACRKGTSGPG